MGNDFYNVKMRSSKGRDHVSGAERIVGRGAVQAVMSDMAERAFTHPNGEPDSISLTINKIVKPIVTIQALPVSEPVSRHPGEAAAILTTELERLGLDGQKILRLLYSLENMRGAALVHKDSLARLEPDPLRGVRATSMDYTGNRGGAKNHMKEALCLASKVASCPFIVAELCISDDPSYTTGYFASQERGYIRLHKIKEKGDPHGGRIFLFGGSRENITECISYIEETPVMVNID